MKKYEVLLNQFNVSEYDSSKLLKTELKNSSTHKDAINIIKQFELSHPDDYLRSCGKSDFTDFPYKKLSKCITDESKYIIARSINNEVHYFVLKNFIDTFEFMQSIVNQGYFDNMKSNSKKIRAHFNSENELLIGTKSTEYKKFLLDEADINSIVKRKYLSYKNTHTYLQAQVAALGSYLGYSTKLARNDKNRSIGTINLNEISTLSMPDSNISNLDLQYQLKVIDYIDIIWADKLLNKTSYGFEVELSNNLMDAFNRLFVYGRTANYMNTKLIIITPNPHDYYDLQQIYLTYSSNTIPLNFYHLTEADLVATLLQRNVLEQAYKLESFLLNKCKPLIS